MSRVALKLRELRKVLVASILDSNQLHKYQNGWQYTRRGSAFKFRSPTVSSIQQYEAMVNRSLEIRLSVVIVSLRLPIDWDQQLVHTRGWWMTPMYENLSCRICLYRNILPRTIETLVMPFGRTLKNINNWVICNFLKIPCHIVLPVTNRKDMTPV